MDLIIVAKMYDKVTLLTDRTNFLTNENSHVAQISKIPEISAPCITSPLLQSLILCR